MSNPIPPKFTDPMFVSFLLGGAFYARMSEKYGHHPILHDIREHCKRSCTAEHCNNCALRKYKEVLNEP